MTNNYIEEVSKMFMENPEAVFIQAGLLDDETTELTSMFESIYKESVDKKEEN